MASSDLKRFVIPGALVVGGITAGSMLAPVAFASAEEDTTDTSESTDSTDTTDQTDDSSDDGSSDRFRRGHRHLDHHPVAEELTETLDMTVEELRAAFAEGKSLADVAAEQGVPVAELEAALLEAATERIDEAVAADRIDADRAAELKEGLADRIREMVNREPGDGFGRGRGRLFGGGGGGEVAEFLGLTTDELRAAFVDGQTLAEVAEAQGISEDELVAFLLEQLEERLDQAVENGRLDADDVDEKLADAAERIEEHINAEPGDRPQGFGDGFRRGHGHRGHHGDDGDIDGPDSDDSSTESGDTDTDGETVESSVDV